MKKKIRRNFLAHTFASLPQADQSLLILYHMLRLSDEEISQRTGIPSGEIRLRRELCKTALAERAAAVTRPSR